MLPPQKDIHWGKILCLLTDSPPPYTAMVDIPVMSWYPKFPRWPPWLRSSLSMPLFEDQAKDGLYVCAGTLARKVRTKQSSSVTLPPPLSHVKGICKVKGAAHPTAPACQWCVCGKVCGFREMPTARVMMLL